MIELIEQNPKVEKFKAYAAVLGILFITFAIPVTITQFFVNDQVGSSADTITPTKSISSYITPTITAVSKPASSSNLQNNSMVNNFISTFVLPYKIYYIFIGAMLLVWTALIIWYFIERKKNISKESQS